MVAVFFSHYDFFCDMRDSVYSYWFIMFTSVLETTLVAIFTSSSVTVSLWGLQSQTPLGISVCPSKEASGTTNVKWTQQIDLTGEGRRLTHELGQSNIG